MNSINAETLFENSQKKTNMPNVVVNTTVMRNEVDVLVKNVPKETTYADVNVVLRLCADITKRWEGGINGAMCYVKYIR